MQTSDVTAVRVAIDNSADIQALIFETPASLTVRTPNASIQIQVMHAQFDDSRSLPPGCHRTYSHS